MPAPTPTAAARIATALTRGDAVAFAVAEAGRLPGVVSAAFFVHEAGGLVLAGRTDGESKQATPPVALRALETRAVAREEGLVALPLARATGTPFGILVLGLSATADPRLTVRTAAEVVEVASALLENERRLQLSASEARQDPLTGLGNRRAFEEHVARQTRDAAVTLLGLVFCDLNDFKSVNDRRGYAAGDEVLREAARVLSAKLRPGEGLFRIGGDEFAVVVRGGRLIADVVAARLEAALGCRTRGPQLPTLSTGIAVFPNEGSTASELVGAAARNLVAGRRSARRTHASSFATPARQVRLLAVDDDPALRLLLRTTFELADISVEEAATVEEAEAIVADAPPHVVVLDVALPGRGGLDFLRQLRARAETAHVPVVVLTGGDTDTQAALDAGADALVRKPFSPLELLATVERLAGAEPSQRAVSSARGGRKKDQLLLYAGDLRKLLELERRQRRALEGAYRETLGALACALELRDTGTGAHSLRVQRYATELAVASAPGLLSDQSVESGFLLHDVGKIGIPDAILQKPGPLTDEERWIMQTHAPIGAEILAEVGQLRGEGIAIVRHHHERWDGGGYPDGLEGQAIPLGARIFAVADALDAMTSDRPYRRAGSWAHAVAEIRAEAGRQFDPEIVAVFAERESSLRLIHREFAAA